MMCELTIQERALNHNIRLVRRQAGDARLIGVVKGNGYGLGLAELAGRLVDGGVRILAVSELSDALKLRCYGIPADIMLLTPLYDPADLKDALLGRVTLCIDTRAGAEAAARVAQSLDVGGKAQLCIDTGFGRYGLPWDDPQLVWETARSLGQLRLTGTYSHLSRSAEESGEENLRQYQRLTRLCRQLEQSGVQPGMRHLADSYGLLNTPEIRLDAVRIGSAFLGRLPFQDRWGFERVGSLSARVREVRSLPAGATVGYGSHFVTPRKTRIAVVGAGYSHGFGVERTTRSGGGLRSALRLLRTGRRCSELLAVSGEHRFPVLGSVGMCDTVLDVTGAEIRVGDRVELPVNPMFVSPEVQRCYI